MENTSTAETKKCVNCGEPVGPGRKDKQYCSDPCKTEFNNKKTAKKRLEKIEPEIGVPEFISGINDILLNNRRILDECLGSSEKCNFISCIFCYGSKPANQLPIYINCGCACLQ